METTTMLPYASRRSQQIPVINDVHSLELSITRRNVINIEKYSKYSTLLRVTAYVRRIISNCRQSSTKITGVLTSTEIEVAEQRWLLACQGSSFVEEITSLKSKVPKRHPLVRQLRLFVDDTGIIRCGGRIHHASVADVTRFPYILPRQHKLTNLIVQDAHENQLHAGTNATATQTRQKYWIPAIRHCVRSVLRKCDTCKRVQGKAYKHWTDEICAQKSA